MSTVEEGGHGKEFHDVHEARCLRCVSESSLIEKEKKSFPKFGTSFRKRRVHEFLHPYTRNAVSRSVQTPAQLCAVGSRRGTETRQIQKPLTKELLPFYSQHFFWSDRQTVRLLLFHWQCSNDGLHFSLVVHLRVLFVSTSVSTKHFFFFCQRRIVNSWGEPPIQSCTHMQKANSGSRRRRSRHSRKPTAWNLLVSLEFVSVYSFSRNLLTNTSSFTLSPVQISWHSHLSFHLQKAEGVAQTPEGIKTTISSSSQRCICWRYKKISRRRTAREQRNAERHSTKLEGVIDKIHKGKHHALENCDTEEWRCWSVGHCTTFHGEQGIPNFHRIKEQSFVWKGQKFFVTIWDCRRRNDHVGRQVTVSTDNQKKSGFPGRSCKNQRTMTTHQRGHAQQKQGAAREKNRKCLERRVRGLDDGWTSVTIGVPKEETKILPSSRKRKGGASAHRMALNSARQLVAV